MSNEVVGYARVSTSDQDLALQLDALHGADVERIFKDVGSGSLKHRPQLDQCLDRLRAGDTLVVWKLDRLARSLGNLIELVLELDRRGVAVRSLTEPIDTTSAMGRFQLQLLGALAELERGLIQERTRAGLEAARARGRTGGRPPAVTKRTLAAALAMLEQGELTMSEIAAELGVGRSTLNRHLARHRAEKDGQATVGATPVGRTRPSAS
jgi:DNA invertase Pin-like site-specific DNA recombinase